MTIYLSLDFLLLQVIKIPPSESLSSVYISVTFSTDEILKASVHSRLLNPKQKGSPRLSLLTLMPEFRRSDLAVSARTSCSNGSFSEIDTANRRTLTTSSSPTSSSGLDLPEPALCSSEATHIALVVEDVAMGSYIESSPVSPNIERRKNISSQSLLHDWDTPSGYFIVVLSSSVCDSNRL